MSSRWHDPAPDESWLTAIVQWAAFLFLVAVIVIGMTAVEPVR